MDEYSRIVIEHYCQTHKTKKAATLFRLVAMSYDLSAEGTDYDAIELEKIISREKNEKMRKRCRIWMTSCSGGENGLERDE